MEELYQKLQKLSEDTTGKLYKAKHKLSGDLVTLKKLHLEPDGGGIPPAALTEIALHQMLSTSIYILRLLSVHHNHHNNKPSIHIVFEFINSDLKILIDSHRIPLCKIQRFMFQLCKGVAHCHGYGVVHRDLKPEHLFVDGETEVMKIAGFGSGRAFAVPLKSYHDEVGSLWYRAPEVLLGSNYCYSGLDMWSVGCIFAEMSRGQALFTGDSEFHQLLHIFRLLGTPTEEQWPGVSSLKDWHAYLQWDPQNLTRAVPSLGPDGVDLLSKMLKYDPAQRISAKAAMDHPYFDSLDKSQF